MAKDNVCFTLRLDRKTYNKIKRLSEASFRSMSQYIVGSLKEKAGETSLNPCIVSGADGIYYLLSPIGYYTTMNTHMFKRFLKGSIPPLCQDWDDVFDSFEEAIENFGIVICEYTPNGVLVKDVDKFLMLYNSNII